jgi:hypothetical protein
LGLEKLINEETNTVPYAGLSLTLTRPSMGHWLHRPLVGCASLDQFMIVVPSSPIDLSTGKSVLSALALAASNVGVDRMPLFVQTRHALIGSLNESDYSLLAIQTSKVNARFPPKSILQLFQQRANLQDLPFDGNV